ncbi:MAG: exosortase/archaeosortase family protein [Planctomycetia bacterium]|nr:exosortase/archaeosortase family protein [Planctomycetia bacterium]
MSNSTNNESVSHPDANTMDSDLLSRQESLAAWGLFGAFMALLIWCYWNMLAVAAELWENDLYSHGYLIPILSIILLAMRYQPLRQTSWNVRTIGAGVVLLATLIRVLFSSIETLDQWTFVISFVGAIIMTGGWSMLRWAGPVAFLIIFMFPPDAVTPLIMDPMQYFATSVSAVFLNVFGFPAIQHGNTIDLNVTQIGVVDQCSGLRMTTIFLALSIALVLINDRKWWENIIILLMAIPIALVTNITRIVVTGMVLAWFPESETISKFIHDAAGICMVPLAIALLMGLQWVLSNIFIEVDEHEASGLADRPEDVFWKDRRIIED